MGSIYLTSCRIYCPLNGIPFGFASFASSFLQKVLGKDVQHVDMLPKLGDVKVAFGILFQCFAQRSSFLFHCFPPSTFSKLIYCF
jgi:hypothetical protein